MKRMYVVDPIKMLDELKIINEVTKEKALVYYNACLEVALLSGHSRRGLLAACVYIATIIQGNKRTVRCLSLHFDVTETTVTNSCKKIFEHIKVEEL